MLIIPPKAQSLKPKAKNVPINLLKHYLSICSSSLFLIIGLNQTALAQSNLIPPPPATCDLNLALLKSADLGKDRNIITADTVSAAGTTTPSLWWTSEQLPPKLVTNWIANNSQKQIYLLVNTQYWNVLDYIDRYRTVDRFGHAARAYGYNLKVCNSQKVALAEYNCDSTSESQLQQVSSQNNSCQIWLNTSGQTGLGVQSK
jgi:hypothetical protein